MFFVLSKVVWFVLTPSNLLALVVAAGALGAVVAPRRRAWAGMALAAATVLLLAGLGPLATWTLLPLEERFPPFRDDGRPVDGIVVLGGAVRPNTSVARGELNLNEAAERMVAMGDLARRHPAAKIVFSGGSGALFEDDVPEADIVARRAADLGLSPGRLIVENRSRTTWENAVETRALVDPKPGERWLLVTSAWHMPRAIGCFRAAGMPVVPYPVDYLTRGSGDVWRVNTLLSRGLSDLDLAVKEWAGLVAYRLTGRTDALLPGPDAV